MLRAVEQPLGARHHERYLAGVATAIRFMTPEILAPRIQIGRKRDEERGEPMNADSDHRPASRLRR